MEMVDVQFCFFCEVGFLVGDVVNVLMIISYFIVGVVFEEQVGDSDVGECGGIVEQVLFLLLLWVVIDVFDEVGLDVVFEQGFVVIVDGLVKRRFVVRNVEGLRKGDD